MFCFGGFFADRGRSACGEYLFFFFFFFFIHSHYRASPSQMIGMIRRSSPGHYELRSTYAHPGVRVGLDRSFRDPCNNC